MRSKVVAGIILGVLAVSCAELELEEELNPFFSDFETPFGVPPFELIKSEHYLPAFQKGMEDQKEEVALIVSSSEPPSFENSVEALERSGALLRKVRRVFLNMTAADTNDALQRTAKEVAPLLAQHRDDILLNADLFERIEAVYEQKHSVELDPEQRTLLDETYKDFVRGGAKLDEEGKADLRRINEELALLSVQFGENVLAETNAFVLEIEDEADLAGLPEAVVSSAAETAAEMGRQGKWVFTLHKPSMIPFLQFSESRELRQRIFAAYVNRGNNGNQSDNNGIAARSAILRAEKARLLGYETYAHYVLEKNMARSPEAVYTFLEQLWKPALDMAKRESEILREWARQEGVDSGLEPWDWWYYAEKERKRKYDLDEESLRPYFKLENVRDGAFGVANRLYGITFEQRGDLPKYHEDVVTFEVTEADGSPIGILYLDYFPRASKRGGAWMDSFRKQTRLDGRRVAPVICNVCNLSPPTGGRPSLLSLEEVGTLFHEFGHALHGLLSDCQYEGLSGTDVPRDFVELPSQIMENWAMHPEVLKTYARHYQTGEPIPQELIDKIEASSKFNQGFAMVEYLAASYLDMDWHTLSGNSEPSAGDFEQESMARIGLIPEIVERYRSPYFNHIFSGGYASGYYSYIWAEVLDADAFQAFKETSLYDQATARSFRESILARGGSENPAVLYQRFRGSEPRIEPLLERKGLTQ